MPLSPLTVRNLGVGILRSPTPRPIYRHLLTQGLGCEEVKMAPDSLIEALRLSSRRPENARTVASLMHAIDRFRRPRAESVLTDAELAAIRAPTLFILGSNDPYLSPRDARPSIDRIPTATLREMRAGHGPWLVEPASVAGLIAAHTHLTVGTGLSTSPGRCSGCNPSRRSIPTGSLCSAHREAAGPRSCLACKTPSSLTP